MAGFTKKAESKPTEKINYVVEITKASILKNNDKKCCFDMKVNGVSISNCFMTIYTNQQNEENETINFPSSSFTASNGEVKYKELAWFPISKELRKQIRAMIEAKLAENA